LAQTQFEAKTAEPDPTAAVTVNFLKLVKSSVLAPI
jgi:hypothetical protein